MKRALKFISVFLGTALAIFLLVYTLNKEVFTTLFDNRASLAEGSEWVEMTYSLKGLTNYIAEHPDRVSIAGKVIGNPDSTLAYHDDLPRTMGLISNFFLLAGYADGFASGRIDPGERLNWEEITRYQLPQIGQAAHQRARRIARNEGWIDRDGQISLEDAVRLLARAKSPALSDFLLIRYGREEMNELYGRLQLTETDSPAPFSGLWLSIAPSIHNLEPEVILEYWLTEPAGVLADEAWEHAQYFSDGDDRSEWLSILEADRLGTSFMQERDLLELFPKTTAREMVRVLTDLHHEELLSAEVSQQLLEWISHPEDDPAVRRHFDRYVALFDEWVGMFAGIDIGTSRYTGDTTVQAVFFDRIHIAVWFHMSSNHMHEDFQQRLIYDPALIEAVARFAGRITTPQETALNRPSVNIGHSANNTATIPLQYTAKNIATDISFYE